MPVVITIAGKAGQVLKLIGLLTMYHGQDTIGKIAEEKKGGVVLPPCTEGWFNTALTKIAGNTRI